MNKTKRFQRFMLLLLLSANALFYCNMKQYDLSQTLIITSLVIIGLLLIFSGISYVTKPIKKKKQHLQQSRFVVNHRNEFSNH